MKIAAENDLSELAKREIGKDLAESKAQQHGERCAYAAPYICFHREAHGWYIQQGCCNHWDCPRCGHIRAREEYGRIVEGAKQIEEDGRKMYFWTLTCRGSEMTLQEAEESYLRWTDRLLTASRNKSNRADEYWCYVQVTERQKRQHPHSHMICTYCPPDAWPYKKGEKLPLGYIAKHDGLWSDWLVDAARRAGLGEMCDLSAVRSAAAVATYISKYLFKDAINTQWPPGWKRVRYSQNWPDLPVQENPTAFPVINLWDWQRVSDIHEPVRADSLTTYLAARMRGVPNVRPPQGWIEHGTL